MRRFGKRRGEEPAVLNFGGLFAYALARRLGLRLLHKGGDFARTDGWRRCPEHVPLIDRGRELR